MIHPLVSFNLRSYLECNTFSVLAPLASHFRYFKIMSSGNESTWLVTTPRIADVRLDVVYLDNAFGTRNEGDWISNVFEVMLVRDCSVSSIRSCPGNRITEDFDEGIENPLEFCTQVWKRSTVMGTPLTRSRLQNMRVQYDLIW